MQDLRYCLYRSLELEERRHAQTVMKELGIDYQLAVPQSMADCWWFWNCTNVPEKLPEYLRPLNLDPHECIGYGLDQEDADAIVARKKA